jgi:hypothetical protein
MHQDQVPLPKPFSWEWLELKELWYNGLLLGGCMDFSRLMDGIVSFAQSSPIIVIVLAVGVLFFIYRKPKLFFGLLGLGLLLAGLFYLIMSISGQGSEKKKALTHKEEQSDTVH